MAWTDDAWKAVEPIFQLILDNKYAKELADGTLSEERFMTFVVQDKLFLDSYARAISLIAARTPRMEDAEMLNQFAAYTAAEQTQMRKFFVENYKLTGDLEDAWENAVKNPACALYTSSMVSHAAVSPVEVAAASILPCFWVYAQLGYTHEKVLEARGNKDTHKYIKWVDTYICKEFRDQTEVLKEYCNRLAEGTTEKVRKDMIAAFVTSVYGELMFFNASYNNEKWPH